MFQRLMETAPGEAVPASTPASTPPTSTETEQSDSEMDYGQLTTDIEAHDAGEDYAPPPVSEPAAEPAKSTEGAAAVTSPPA